MSFDRICWTCGNVIRYAAVSDGKGHWHHDTSAGPRLRAVQDGRNAGAPPCRTSSQSGRSYRMHSETWSARRRGLPLPGKHGRKFEALDPAL